MPITTYNNGTTNTVTSGTFAGILVDVDGSNNPTTLTLSNATDTGPNAHETYPPLLFTDVEGGVYGIIVMPTCTFADAGGSTVTGGDGLAGKTAEADTTPGLQLPTYGPGDGLYASGATLSFTGSHFTGGNYTAGDPGSIPTPGGAGATVIAPVSLSLGAGVFTGGVSESTLPGAPGFILQGIPTATFTFGALGGFVLKCIGGFGSSASQGPSLILTSPNAPQIHINAGLYTGAIACSLAAGSKLRFSWAFGFPGTLTTSSVSGLLNSGDSISTTITGGGAATVFNDPGGTYSELQF